MYAILDKITSPADLKGLGMEELRQLCAELRGYIIECCSTNPGHLASSLGAVELIVGMHYVFDAPGDKIVFDVGHQAYAHKILTGRREAFRTLRTEGGLSGFPKRSESEYDCFGAGHSSTSISAALGFACASKMMGLDEKVIALIGDGAMTGGLAFEGLNNAGAGNADLLVILNDNNQSIAENHGGIYGCLARLRATAGAAQEGAGAAHHLHHPEGLGEVVVGPGVERLHGVELGVLGGEHHHGDGLHATPEEGQTTVSPPKTSAEESAERTERLAQIGDGLAPTGEESTFCPT